MSTPVISSSRVADRVPAVPLTRADRDRLLRHARTARRRAQRSGHAVLAAITVDAPDGLDAMSTIACGRRKGESWSVYGQRDRDDQVLATLGCVQALEASGSARFATVSAGWTGLTGSAVADDGRGAEAEGIVAVGGFAFADDGATTPTWDGFAPASLIVPQLALAGRAGRVRATIIVRIAQLDDPESVAAAALERVDRVAPATAPLLDPDPVQRARIVSALPPAHYEHAVQSGVDRIREGAFEKIVLAREVQVAGRPTPDPAAVLGVLRDAYDGCCVLAVGRGDRTFIAATPELLVRRAGNKVATLALAGTTGRSSDPAVETHLGEHLLRSAKNREEHAIVVRRILARLDDLAIWTMAAPRPEVVKAASAQHLATPIRAHLASSAGVLDLVERLHPTPAVGGFPEPAALPLIPALEAMDRGWYAGPVGWIDAAGDGDFSVALRSALLEPELARCYAGVGVVEGSDPAAELAETEVKLQALLPVLSA